VITAAAEADWLARAAALAWLAQVVDLDLWALAPASAAFLVALVAA
jgi:hypothetical protein